MIPLVPETGGFVHLRMALEFSCWIKEYVYLWYTLEPHNVYTTAIKMKNKQKNNQPNKQKRVVLL